MGTWGGVGMGGAAGLDDTDLCESSKISLGRGVFARVEMGGVEADVEWQFGQDWYIRLGLFAWHGANW